METRAATSISSYGWSEFILNRHNAIRIPYTFVCLCFTNSWTFQCTHRFFWLIIPDKTLFSSRSNLNRQGGYKWGFAERALSNISWHWSPFLKSSTTDSNLLSWFLLDLHKNASSKKNRRSIKIIWSICNNAFWPNWYACNNITLYVDIASTDDLHSCVRLSSRPSKQQS